MPLGQVLFEHYSEWLKVDHIRRSSIYMMSPHMHHDRFEIYYLLNGSRDYLVRDSIYTVKKGELMLLPAGELHKTLENSRPEHERIVIEFDQQLLENELTQTGLPLLDVFQTDHYVMALTDQQRIRVEKIMFELIHELREEGTGYMAVARYLIAQLLILLYRLPEQREDRHAVVDDSAYSWLAGITRYIHDHYDEDLSLTSLADTFAVSPWYLSRTFHKGTGMHLPDYVNLIRVKEAKQRLIDGQQRITDIALAVGYNNVTHFGRVFRKVYGQSPSDMRRVIRLSRGESS